MIGVPAEHVISLLRKSCDWGQDVTDSDVIAMLAVCATYRLNPITKEIYLMKNPKNGRFIQYISVDGFVKIAQNSNKLNGFTFAYEWEPDGKTPFSCTCSMHVKGMKYPVEVTELLSECYRDSSPVWKLAPVRMLRHKTLRQAVRLAFGISVPDDEDVVDIVDATAPNLTSEQQATGVRGLKARMVQPKPTLTPESPDLPMENPDQLPLFPEAHELELDLDDGMATKIKHFWTLIEKIMPKAPKSTGVAFEKWLLQHRWGGKTSLKQLTFAELHQLNRCLDSGTGEAWVKEFALETNTA